MAVSTTPVVQFHPYQKKWLHDASRFKIGMFARQTGKTFTSCGEIVDDCIQHEIEAQRTHWVFLSRGERQAKEAMEEGVKPFTKAFWAAYKALLQGHGPEFFEDVFIGGDGTRYKTREVIFPGGSRITALPANPDTARGFSGNVFLDEFAFHLDSRKIWGAVFPVISKGYKIRVMSTPNGKGNKFYDLMTGKDTYWSRHIVDIYAAVKQGLPRDIQALRQGLGDDDLWAQEYELKWLDEASAWLPYDLISTVEDVDAGKPELYTGGPCYIGNDIAIRGHLWIAWVLEEVGDVLWTREIRVLRRATFAEQDAVMDELWGKYRVVRACMDQTGMGEKPVEDAKGRYGDSRVEGVLFNAGNKQILATLGKEVFENRTIRIPAGDPALKSDLHKLKKVVGPTGTPRFVAESGSGGHADRAWALFLAVNGASTKYQPFTYIPVTGEQKRVVRAGSGVRAGKGLW